MMRSKVDRFNCAPRCHPPPTKGVFGEFADMSPSVGGPSSNIGNTKSGIMKKAKLEFLNSREVKNLSAMKKTNFQNNQRVSPIIKKPSHFPGKSSSTPSSSKFSTSTSTARRF
uniref:Uncharacterized protein n=1 Tax=Lactuca sativa TaxID=4236 RepID=A0A9R1URB4_LACSA|nr:hypothetical protein LSAT_V11C800401770 [Lactuca sativa]